MNRATLSLALEVAALAERMRRGEPMGTRMRADLLTLLPRVREALRGAEEDAQPADPRAIFDAAFEICAEAGVDGRELAEWFNEAAERHARPASRR
ncbi:hypothetical protein [Roseomonas genomospecies 6]|uniref:Uncharacterized protein n=1 Tax=Roseomonas genomospecies 6 TaxID=214106 RepID=A0A9W7KS49_9PROT|nr:hypothetical protein [Roseomonas genomospecies 6]KAA0678097.1 hypothetical protein DS843_21175 [Roseomonas genomospecies 6]